MESNENTNKKQPPAEDLLPIPEVASTSTSNAENMSPGGKRKVDENAEKNNNNSSKRLALMDITNQSNPAENKEEEENANQPNPAQNQAEQEEPAVAVAEEPPEEADTREVLIVELVPSTQPFYESREMGIDMDEEDEEPVYVARLTPKRIRFYEDDPLQKWIYATDIFNIMKHNERRFLIGDYMPRQEHLTALLRTYLVNWMVNVQRQTNLFNETLCLAVKIVDLHLCGDVIEERQLQLLGVTAFIIAIKYLRARTPCICRFLTLCDQIYQRDDVLAMERKTLRVLDYKLEIPMSCSFLHRYVGLVKVPRPTWILSRYILELALMDYTTISESDSQMAAAALFMALRMRGKPETLDGNTWNRSLCLASGYNLSDFARLVPLLNAELHSTDYIHLNVRATREKYSDRRFYNVAKIPPLSNEELFRDNPYLYAGN